MVCRDITACRDWLVGCGVPKADIKGEQVSASSRSCLATWPARVPPPGACAPLRPPPNPLPLPAPPGFRSPYLVHNPQVRSVLHQAGFLYDSSIDEVFPSSTSPGSSARLWGGYTMDYGLPQVSWWRGDLHHPLCLHRWAHCWAAYGVRARRALLAHSNTAWSHQAHALVALQARHVAPTRPGWATLSTSLPASTA